MGELAMILKVPIEGKNQELEVPVGKCENAKCGRAFVRVRKNHKYCSVECKEYWKNKTS